MLKIWLPIGAILGLVFLALFSYQKMYTKGLQAGRAIEYSENIIRINGNVTKMAADMLKDDMADLERLRTNEKIVLSGSGGCIVDANWLRELAKLR